MILAVGEFGMVVWGLVFVVATIYLIVSRFRSTSKTKRLRTEAQQLLASGRWEEAAGRYKEAIVIRLDSAPDVDAWTIELEDFYREHGHEVELNDVRELPHILKDIEKSKANPKETGRLIGEAYLKAQTLLDGCGPGEIRDEE